MAKLRAQQVRRLLGLLALLLASTLAAGYATGRVAEWRALHQDGADAREQLRLYASTLQGYIERYRTLPAVLALDPEVRAALTGKLDAATQNRLNRQLERVNGVMQASTLTLIDRSGMSVAASNWNLPSSNVGHDYAFRPYFGRAVQNGSGMFYGVGVTTGVAGFFMSEAIRDADGQLLGVVVIKLELQDLEAAWQDNRDIVLASDEHGVVILANRPEWHYRGLRPLNEPERAEIARTRPYVGHEPQFLARGSSRSLDQDGDLVEIGAPGSRREVLWQTVPLPAEGWSLHLLRDPEQARGAGRIAALAAAGVWLALVFLTLSVQGRVRLARLRRRSREELEQMVQQHAADLRTARDGVVEAAQRAAFGQNASLEHLPQGVSVIDADLRLRAWNRRYVELFRYPPELVQVGRPIADLVRYNAERGWLGLGGNAEEAIARRLSHLRAATPYLHERERPDGTVLEIRGNPVPGGGFVTSYADITAYKNAARELRTLAETLELRVRERTSDLQVAKGEAERANLYKTRFIAAAVHDLLQPLNAARMFVSALRRRAPQGEAHTLVENLDEALSAQDAILGGLLDISRLESGALEVKRRELRLDALFESLARDFGVLAQSRGLELRRRPTRAVVYTDEDLLRRILQNFLSNAIRYTPRGRILLGCRRAGEHVRIEVWDTGVGIPEAQYKAIFEEFRRLDTGRNTQDRGAGLGLAIVERVAQLLGHPIGVRSWPGRGSVFAVTVPLGSAAPASAPRPADDDGSSLHGVHVWCLDDDARVREGTRALLDTWDCCVTLLADADSALQRAAAEPPPQVLLLDYKLEDRLGPDCLPALFAAWGRKVPVIVISADRDPALQAAAREAGWGFLAKPIRPAALRALISRLIAGDI